MKRKQIITYSEITDLDSRVVEDTESGRLRQWARLPGKAPRLLLINRRNFAQMGLRTDEMRF